MQHGGSSAEHARRLAAEVSEPEEDEWCGVITATDSDTDAGATDGE